MTAKPKRPRDTNERARLIVDIATGEVDDENPDEGKDPKAVERGRLGGKKGGKARAANLTPKQRTAAAKKAVLARWARGADH